MNTKRLKTILSLAVLTTLVVPAYAFAGVDSNAPGNYHAYNVDGIGVKSHIEVVNAAVGVENNKAYVTTDESAMGPYAQTSLYIYAKAIGVEVGPEVDIFLGTLQSNGIIENVDSLATPLEFTIGIPEDFMNAGYNYGVISVSEQGEVALLSDTDLNANTVTFSTDNVGAFAVVRSLPTNPAIVSGVAVDTTDKVIYDGTFDVTGYPAMYLEKSTGDTFYRLHDGEWADGSIKYGYYNADASDSMWYNAETKTFVRN